MEAELADLAMSKASLEVDLECVRLDDSPLLIEGRPVDFSSEGFDRVSFLLQANPGEQKGPVARVASGGELSRIYLALQLAVGETPAEFFVSLREDIVEALSGRPPASP